MNAKDYCAAIKQLGMTAERAGRFFQVNRSTAFRWTDHGCPAMASMWLKFMIASKTTPDWVDHWLGRDTSKKD